MMVTTMTMMMMTTMIRIYNEHRIQNSRSENRSKLNYFGAAAPLLLLRLLDDGGDGVVAVAVLMTM